MPKQKNLPYIETLKNGSVTIIGDSESGSKSILPVLAEENYKIMLIHIDKGLVKNFAYNCKVSDKLLLASKIENQKASPRLACMTELKGTGKETEVSSAVKQIYQTLSYEELKPFLSNQPYVVAIIAGEPNKKLPRLLNTNPDLKKLVNLLLQKSCQRKNIKNGMALVYFAQLNQNIGKATVTGALPPYTILCSSKRECALPFPSILLSKIENTGK